MKRLLAILVVATMLVSIIAMTPVLNAATADTVINSAEGTAVIDGVKDDAYANATELVFDQCGSSNGGGAVLDTPAAHGYVINDAEWVYVFYDVHDTDLDNTATNSYEQDSIELFYMENNTKQQWRIHYDEGNADADQTKVDTSWYAVVVGDNGYTVECKFPITDVLNNQIEMLMQVDWCSGGKRDATVYITGHPEGDDGWQRDNRQTTYDCWWTLQLVGEFEDTRVDPVEEAEEITVKNYATIKNTQFFTQLFGQDVVSWGWFGVGSGAGSTLGQTVEMNWNAIDLTQPDFNAENTSDFTKAPNYSIQVSCNGTMAAGDSAHYIFSVSDITITAEGYDNVVIPAQELDCKWVGKEESWGISGTDSSIELGTPIRDALGISIQQFCEEYIPAITNINYTLTLDSYNLNTLADVEAFEEGLAELEQAFIDETLAEYTTKVNEALTAAQAAGDDADALKKALDDANKALNRATKEVENSGYAADGLAATYVKDTLGAVVAEIQSMVDAAAPAEPEPAEDNTPEDNTPAAPSSSSTSSEGGSTGLIVGIVVAVVVVVAAVVGIVLGKKKK